MGDHGGPQQAAREPGHENRWPEAVIDEGEDEAPAVSFSSEGGLPDVGGPRHDDSGPSASDIAYGPALQFKPAQAQGAKAAPPPPPMKARPQFTTLKATKLDATTKGEAAVLRALRSSHVRIDPTWLLEAQTQTLHIADATGAMNTETVRAIHAREGRAVPADELLTTAFLNRIHDNGRSPLAFDTPRDGFTAEARNEKATRPADLAAQAVGRADYRSYRDEMVPLTFLGFDFVHGKSDGQAHPYLAGRLQLAETFLRNLFAEQVAQAAATSAKGPQGDALVAKLAGWNGEGGARYDFADAHVDAGKDHQHTMGLAIDIDPYVNGWLWDNNHGTHPSINKHLELASRLFGGRAFTASTLDARSNEISTEELHAEVSQASSAFGRYLSLVKGYRKQHDDAPDKEAADTAIIADLKAKGLAGVDAVVLKDMLWFAGWFNGAQTRGKGMTALTNIKMPMLVALRDVAGLNWGGAEMNPAENGDFMHFDCRDTAFGQAMITAEAKAAEEKRKAAATAANAKKKKK